MQCFLLILAQDREALNEFLTQWCAAGSTPHVDEREVQGAEEEKLGLKGMNKEGKKDFSCQAGE